MANRWNDMARRISGLNPLAYIGVEPTTPPQLVVKNRAPTVNDIKPEGTLWVNNNTTLLKNNEVWVNTKIYAGTTPGPLLGSRQSNWVNLMTTSDTQFNTDDGIYAHPINGILNVFGGTNIQTSTLVVGGNTINVYLRDDVVIASSLRVSALASAGVVQTDATGLFFTSTGTDGQVIIGGAAAPIWANLVAGAGINITNGPNSITITATGAGGFGGLKDNADVIATPDGVDTVKLVAGSMITTTAGVNSISIAIPDAGAVATPQVVFAPAAGGSPAWGRIATAGGATIVEAGGVITITAGAGGAGGAVLLHTDGPDAAIDIVDSSFDIIGGPCIETAGLVDQVLIGITQGNDGQVIIGATGNDPVWATITSSDASITITPGANTLDLTTAGGITFGGLIADDANTAAPDGAGKVTIGGLGVIETTSTIANTLNIGITDPGVSIIPANGVQMLWSPLAGGTASWGTVVGGFGITITEALGIITVTNTGGGGGGGVNVFNCDSGTASPLPATPTLIHIIGDASAGYTNIQTIGSTDFVEVVLQDSLCIPDTNAGGTAGVIYFDGARTKSFIHKYGTQNTFYGEEAGNRTLTVANATANTGIGISALKSLTDAKDCAALGAFAGTSITSGGRNTLVGSVAGFALTTGASNTFIGCSTGKSFTTGSFNIAIGDDALDAITTTSGSLGIGYQAGTDITSGVYNSVIGYQSGANISTGNYNTALGYQSLLQTTSGDNNTALGYKALTANTTANGITALGSCALLNQTTGTGNTAVGYSALRDVATNDYNTAVGYDAARNTTASNNTALGYQSLYTNTNASGCTAIGYKALYTSGGLANNNTAVGQNALTSLTTATNCTAVGSDAFSSAAAGIENTGIGAGCGGTGSYTTAVGYSAVSGSGARNTGIGVYSLAGLTTGYENNALGVESGNHITTGHDNILIGYQAGTSLTTSDSNNTLIGDLGSAGLNNTIKIGSQGGAANACYVQGIYNKTIGATNHPVGIDSTGKLGVGVWGGYVAFAAKLNGIVTNVSGDDTKFYLGNGGVAMSAIVNNGGGTFDPSGPAYYKVPIKGIYMLTFTIRLNGIRAPIVPPAPIPAVAVDPISIEVTGTYANTWSFFPVLTWNGWQSYESCSFSVTTPLDVNDIVKWFIQIDYRPGPDFTATGRYKCIGIDGVVGGLAFTHVGVTLLTSI